MSEPSTSLPTTDDSTTTEESEGSPTEEHDLFDLEEPEEELDTSDMSIRSMLIQTIVATAVVVGLVALLAKFFFEPFQAIAKGTLATLGLPGVLFGLWLTDTFTFPIPTDTYLVVAVASQSPMIPTMIAICIVSMFAGNCAYFVGPWLTKIKFINRRIEAFRPKGEKLFGRWGVGAVAIGALTPLPYSIICWFAGIYKMKYKSFFWSTFFRIPRMVIYYLLIADRWVAG